MIVELKDVCNKGTSNVRQKDIVSKPGDYPIYGASGLAGNVNFYQQEKASVAVVKDGAGIGRAMLLPAKASIIGTMQYLIPKDNVLPEYLYYAVRNMHLEKYYSGATIPHIYFKDYKKEKFNLVSLNQQRKIITLFNGIENTINKRKKELSKLDTLIKARFVEMFGDPIVNPYNFKQEKLERLSCLITKGASPTWQGFNYVEDDDQTLFITSENVKNGYLDLKKSKYVENKFNDKHRRSILQKGDFLINIVGASIGRAAQYSENKLANINQAVALVRLKLNVISSVYLSIYLNSNKALDMYQKMQSNVARANLSLQNIKDLEIILPPIELQNEFASFVQQVDKSKVAIQKSLDETQTLFDSLMEKYFS